MVSRYSYTVIQKITFVTLWVMAVLFVIINYFSNPLLSVDSATPLLSKGLAVTQAMMLVTLWGLFFRACCSMEGILRWLGIGVIVLPYIIQLGLLYYLTF